MGVTAWGGYESQPEGLKRCKRSGADGSLMLGFRGGKAIISASVDYAAGQRHRLLNQPRRESMTDTPWYSIGVSTSFHHIESVRAKYCDLIASSCSVLE